MVVILTTESGRELAARSERWNAALELARTHGWSPQGSVRPGVWDGSYVRPCGQMIASADARKLAAALRDALDDVPDHRAAPLRADRAPSPVELFSGPAKTELTAIADFLVRGACTVFGACDGHRETPSI